MFQLFTQGQQTIQTAELDGRGPYEGGKYVVQIMAPIHHLTNTQYGESPFGGAGNAVYGTIMGMNASQLEAIFPNNDHGSDLRVTEYSQRYGERQETTNTEYQGVQIVRRTTTEASMPMEGGAVIPCVSFQFTYTEGTFAEVGGHAYQLTPGHGGHGDFGHGGFAVGQAPMARSAAAAAAVALMNRTPLERPAAASAAASSMPMACADAPAIGVTSRTCVVCLDFYNSQLSSSKREVALACGHSFCYSCLNKENVGELFITNCPECRTWINRRGDLRELKNHTCVACLEPYNDRATIPTYKIALRCGHCYCNSCLDKRTLDGRFALSACTTCHSPINRPIDLRRMYD